jgi:hypothetical protein
MKFPGDQIDENDEEVADGSGIYEANDCDYYYTATNGTVTGTFKSLDGLWESEILRQQLRAPGHFQEWLQSFG